MEHIWSKHHSKFQKATCKSVEFKFGLPTSIKRIHSVKEVCVSMRQTKNLRFQKYKSNRITHQIIAAEQFSKCAKSFTANSI